MGELHSSTPEPRISLPYPSGWFALATSAEVRADRLLTRRMGGEEYVLFRDAEGEARAVRAYCPHLGAHFGHGGRVESGQVVCPFHGFRFDGEGTCVATGYGTRPPKKARLPACDVLESGGWVFAWFHPARLGPTWTPPVLAEEGWSRLRTHAIELGTHPQETTENSVDLGHFPLVHGYRDVSIAALDIEGPHLHTRYSFTRPGAIPGLGKNLRVEIAVHVWGLGFSYVDVCVPALGLETRQFVLPTAVAPGRTELRLGMVMRKSETAPGALAWMPDWMIDRVVAPITMRHYVGDVMQDRVIWENKIHVEHPPLAEGDGPIGRYRRYCRQFYPGALAARAVGA